MEAAFEIDVDPVASLVKMKLSGFFTAESFAALVAARAVAFRRLRCGPNQHLSLTDIRAMKIQSQEMVATFSTMLADPKMRSRRLAFVVASSLARIQLQRAVGSREARFFTDPVEAERWVLTGDEAAAA